MRYIMMNDFYQILKEKSKYFISYFIVICIFFIFESCLHFDYNDIYLSLLGIKIIKKNILFILLYLSNILISLFIAYNIFSNDFKNSLDNLFLRISPRKWLFCKSISCLFFTFLFRGILCFMVTSILFFFYKVIDIWYILVFLKSIFYFTFIQFLFILIVYLLQSKKYVLFLLPIFLFFLFLGSILIILSDIWWVYLMLSILSIILLMYVYGHCFVNLFERNGVNL